MNTTSKTSKGSITKHGSITSTKQLGLLPRIPDLEGHRPLLFAELSDEMGLPSTTLQHSVSAELLEGSEQPLYSFRLQIGTRLIVWLANPYAPETLNMLQNWASVGDMLVGVKTGHGMLVHTRPVVGGTQFIDGGSIASNAVDTKRFIRTAREAVSSGLVKARAVSDIACVPKIRKVHVFVVLSAEVDPRASLLSLIADGTRDCRLRIVVDNTSPTVATNEE